MNDMSLYYKDINFNCSSESFKGVNANIMNIYIHVTATGENEVTYTNVFYIGKETIASEFTLRNVKNNSEVSQIGWFTYEEAKIKIRNYHPLIVNTLEELKKNSNRIRDSNRFVCSSDSKANTNSINSSSTKLLKKVLNI